MAKVTAKVYDNGSYGGSSLESLESMVKRFNKKCEREGVLKDLRKQEYYISKSLKRKLKKENARKERAKEEAKRQAYENGKTKTAKRK